MTVVCEQAHRVSLGSTWASPRAGESGTHVAEGTLAAVSLAELSPDAGDGDGLAAVVVDADVEEVGRDAIVDGRERVGVGELDEGLDVGRGDGRTEGEGGKGEGSCVRGRGRGGGGGGGGGGGVSDNGVGERESSRDGPSRGLGTSTYDRCAKPPARHLSSHALLPLRPASSPDPSRPAPASTASFCTSTPTTSSA